MTMAAWYGRRLETRGGEPTMRIVLSVLTAFLVTAGCASTSDPEAPPGIDFGDYSSETLTTSAWVALSAGHYEQAVTYADMCVKLYEEEARRMQGSMDAPAHRDHVFDYWALNDVGTSYFIKGEALAKLGRKEEAIAAYTVVRDELFYAQTWDPKGWFWRPSTASYPKIQMLSGDF